MLPPTGIDPKMPVVANQVLQLDDRHAVALLDVAGKAQQGQSSWAFRQVGLVNNVAKGKRKATMASGRLSMVGPFSESGVRPAYPDLYTFSNFCGKSNLENFAQSRLGKGIHHKAVARILAFRPPTKKRRHSSLGAGKPGDGISRYFDWFRQSREYRNRLFRHSRAA